MKNVLANLSLAALITFGAYRANAMILQVVVQCDEAGPQYPGSLDIPNQNQISCDTYNIVRSMKVPVVLRFNSFAYIVDEDSFDTDEKCNVKTLTTSNTSASEATSSLSEEFRMYAMKGGYYGSLGHCGFKTRP